MGDDFTPSFNLFNLALFPNPGSLHYYERFVFHLSFQLSVDIIDRRIKLSQPTTVVAMVKHANSFCLKFTRAGAVWKSLQLQL